jgi:hypothetical protein
MAGWKFYLDNIEVEEPIGWDGIEFTAIRMDSHGIDQPFSTEVKFYDKGARYIKLIFDQFYINRPIAITITSDVGYDGQDYQFDGFLNLAIYQEHNVCDTDSFEVTVGIIDDDFREDFKARQDVEIDLTSTTDLNGDAISALTFKNIRLHKQQLLLNANGKNLADSTVYTQFGPAGFTNQNIAVVPTFWESNDFVGSYGTILDTNAVQLNYTADYGQSPFFYNNTGSTRTLEISITDLDIELENDFNGNPVTVYFRIHQFDSGNNPTIGIVIYQVNLNPGQLLNHTINWSGSISVPAGDKACITAWTFNSFSLYPTRITIFEGLKISVQEYNNANYASTCNVLTIEQWLRRAIYVMTGDNNMLLSDVFSESGSGCYWNNALTTGARIRGVDPFPGFQTLKTTWKQVFDGLDRIFCLGWAFEWTGTEWKVRVEPREYFYQNSISQTFTNVGEVDQMAKSEDLVNNITLGFSDKWKNIQISGAYAIHTDRNYFIDNRAMAENSTASLDIRSDIIAEGYCIEFYRRMSYLSFGSGSSDRPNDYDTFIIWLNRQEIALEDVEGTCFNLPEETGSVTFAPGEVSMPSSLIAFSSGVMQNLYNIFHTPARVGMRWWKVLGMHTYGLVLPATGNPSLQFQIGEYQTTYFSQIDDSQEPCQQYLIDTPLYENVSIDTTVLRAGAQDYLFKPISVQFTYPQSLCDFLTLSQDEQYRKVRLTSGSLDIQGFITEAKNKPEDSAGGTTTFTLLVSAQDALAGGAFDSGYDTGYD